MDLSELIARERGYSVDLERFNLLMKEQKSRSKAARKVNAQEVELPLINEKTEFVGYDNISVNAKVLYAKDNQIVLDKTPFYTESGGQTSDTGAIILAGETYNVIDSKKSGSAIIHICDREVEELVGSYAIAQIDLSRRKDIMRNHSATHLLHEALREVLGNHIQQSGSSVNESALRFDFNHFEKVSIEDLAKVEKIANQKVLEGIDVDVRELSIEEARKNPKIKMFFGDKYGDIVRVVTMDEKYSIELCGGTHVKNTADIGLIKITSESSIAAGVRRIEAITGRAVFEFIDNLENKIENINKHTEELNSKIYLLEKEISKLKQDDLAKEYNDWINSAKLFGEIKIIVQTITADELDTLRNTGEQLRDVLSTKGIALIASVIGDKVQLCCVVTDDLKAKYPAGKLVGESAKLIGGGGGGKPHLATAGGKDINKLSELIENFQSIVEKF